MRAGRAFSLGAKISGWARMQTLSVHPLQDAHQTSGVIVVAVAEADQIDSAQIEMQGIGIMQHHLRGSARVQEQLHILRAKVQFQKDGQAMLGPDRRVAKGSGVFNHNGQTEVLQHDKK